MPRPTLIRQGNDSASYWVRPLATLHLLGLVLSAAAAGCCRTPPPAPPPRPQPAPARPEGPAGQAAPMSLEAVPAQAKAVFCLGTGLFAAPQNWLASRPAMLAEMRELMLRRIGLDLTRVNGAVGWSSSFGGTATFAVFLSTRDAAPGTEQQRPKWQRAGDHRGVALFALDGAKLLIAELPGGLLLGSPEEVRLGIDRAKGLVAPLPDSSPILSLLPRPLRAELLIGLDASGLTGTPAQTAVQQFDLRAATFTLELDRLVLRLSGAHEKLAGLKQLIMLGLGTAVQTAEAQKRRAVDGSNLPEALGAIAGAHELGHIATEVEPRLVGDRLLAEYRLPRLGELGPLTWLGMGAAVAVPAFIKYLNKSRAAEARESLTAISHSVLAYYEAHRRKGRGFRFPDSTDWTPAAACCSAPGKVCSGDPATLYGHPTWQALQYQRSGGHRYQVRFVSEGRGKNARFSIEARGDLDCDGKFSSYRLTGRIDKEGELQIGELEVSDELE